MGSGFCIVNLWLNVDTSAVYGVFKGDVLHVHLWTLVVFARRVLRACNASLSATATTAVSHASDDRCTAEVRARNPVPAAAQPRLCYPKRCAHRALWSSQSGCGWYSRT